MQPEAAVPTAEIVFNTASAKTNSILTYTEANIISRLLCAHVIQRITEDRGWKGPMEML